MFGDFLTLIADQLINHMTKFAWMYSGGKRDQDAVRVPLVIRTPMGGRRGYGPTHSQTLEKIFLGVPGLRILAPSALGDPGGLLSTAILKDDQPVLFIENKLLYLLPVQDPFNLEEFDIDIAPLSTPASHFISGDLPEVENPIFYAPTYSSSIRDAPSSDLTLVAYGHMAELARQAVLQMAYDREIFIDLVIPTQLAPLNIEPILTSVLRTGRLLVAEEGSVSSGWGAEVLARAVEAAGPRLKIARRVAAKNFPIPASGPLESAVLPGVDEIIQIAQKMI
jgi:pyruvate/2-oxoglutarate/acetoin dehydrogenase E1 component